MKTIISKSRGIIALFTFALFFGLLSYPSVDANAHFHPGCHTSPSASNKKPKDCEAGCSCIFSWSFSDNCASGTACSVE